jgi:hypothetical protein
MHRVHRRSAANGWAETAHCPQSARPEIDGDGRRGRSSDQALTMRSRRAEEVTGSCQDAPRSRTVGQSLPTGSIPPHPRAPEASTFSGRTDLSLVAACDAALRRPVASLGARIGIRRVRPPHCARGGGPDCDTAAHAQRHRWNSEHGLHERLAGVGGLRGGAERARQPRTAIHGAGRR